MNKATPDFTELQVSRRIFNSPDTVAAVDRHKLSPNAFNDVFAATVRARGDDINNFVLRTSTSSQTIKKISALRCMMKSKKTLRH